MIEDSYSLFTRMKSGVRTTGLGRIKELKVSGTFSSQNPSLAGNTHVFTSAFYCSLKVALSIVAVFRQKVKAFGQIREKTLFLGQDSQDLFGF